MPTPRETLKSTASQVALRVGELSIRRRMLVAQVKAIDVELEKAYKGADALDQAVKAIDAIPPDAPTNSEPPPIARHKSETTESI